MLFRLKKLIRRFAIYPLLAVILLSVLAGAKGAGATYYGNDPVATYINKTDTGTLAAVEWRNLRLDFVNTWGSSTPGAIGIGVDAQSTDINGLVASSTIKTNNNFLGSISASYVTPGAFNSTKGTGGNYSFPGVLSVGTTTTNGLLNLSGANPIFNINSTNFNRNFQMLIDSSGVNALWPVTGNFGIYNNAGTLFNFYINGSTNNVGIGAGMTSPAQALDIAGNLNLSPVTPPVISGMVATVQSASGNLGVGNYSYSLSYLMSDGTEAVQQAPISAVTTSAGNTKILLTNIPVSTDPRVTARYIYRTTVGGNIYLTNGRLVQIDNATTTYLDNLADSNVDLTRIIYRRPNMTGGKIYLSNHLIAFAPDIYTASFGYDALKSLTTGNSNAAFGGIALQVNSSGSDNSAMGYSALSGISNGSDNAGLGYAAGASVTTGSSNTFLGASAGYSGSQLVSANNSTAIGYGAYTTASNQVVIGNTSVTQTLLNGSVAIGTTSIPNVFNVNGAGNFNNFQIHNVGAPTAAADAVTKSYVDSVTVPPSNSTATAGYWTGNGSNDIYNANSGKVGIGTTAPNTPLQVLGKINSITSVARGTNVEFLGVDAANNANYPRGFFYGHSGSAIVNFGFYAASGDATGGVQTPAFMGVSTNADVKQAASVQGLIYVDTTKMAIYNTLAEGTSRAVPMYFGASTNPDLTISTTGKVGIGTTQPQEMLHILANAGNTAQPSSITNSVNDAHTGLFINNSYNLVNSKFGIQFGGYNQYGFGGIFGVMTSNSGATIGDLTFDLKGATSDANLTERMRITGPGLVGIGTSSPTTAQLVVGTSTNNYTIDFGSYRAGNLATPISASDAATKSYVDSAISTGYWTQSGSYLYTSSTSWNVGIGATSTDKLYVNGNIGLPITTTTAGFINMGGVRYLHSFGNTNNLFVGYLSGNTTTLTTATEDTFLGTNAGQALTTGSYNTAVGRGAGAALTTGIMNTFVGRQTGGNVVTGSQNTLLGVGAGESWTGGNAVMVGYYAGRWNSAGNYNTILGTQANRNAISNSYTVALGNGSLYNNSVGNGNIGIGYNTDYLNPPATMTATPVAGTNLGVGNYYYRVTYVINGNDSEASSEITAVTTSGNQNVNLTNIPVYSGPYTCTARKIYRNKVNGYFAGGFNLLTTIGDNVTTTYSDTTSDASLSATLLSDSSNSVIIGTNAFALKPNQFILGSGQTEIWLGEGIYASNPGTISLLATGGLGTNNPGANLLIGAGQGTGSALGGDIIFKTAAPGSSGSLFNALSEIMRITNSGYVGIGTSSPSTAAFVVATSSNNYAIDVNNYRIGNVGAPVSAKDAATKSYVDSITVPGGSSTSTAGYWTGLGSSNIYNSNLGNVSIGTTTTGYPLLVVSSSALTLGLFQSNVNNYSELNVQNTNTGNNASSDFTATANNGTASSYYVNLGINNSNYNQASFNITGADDSYLYSSDASLAIGVATSSATAALKFFTGGTLSTNERMRIDSTGRVGIGTTNPGQLLDLSKAATSSIGAILNLINPAANAVGNAVEFRFAPSISYTSRYASIQGINNDGNNNIDLAFLTGAGASITEKMRIAAGGNVGIGTPSPTTAQLVVATSSTNYAVDVNNYRIGNVGTPISPGDAVNLSYLQSSIGTAQNAYWTQSSTNLYPSSTSWNIGLGTTTPGSILPNTWAANATNSKFLEIRSTDPAYDAGIFLRRASSGSDTGLDLWADNSAGTAYIDTRYNDATYGNLYFRMKTAGTPLTAMTIMGGGNVGIGTTTPSNPLQVYSSNAVAQALFNGYSVIGSSANLANGTILLGNNSGYQGIFDYNSGGNTTMTIKNSYSYASALMNFDMASIHAISILGNGKIGFGTTSPSTAQLVIATSSVNYSLDAGNYKIGNVAVPTVGTDAANKTYVDSALANSYWTQSGSYLYASSTSWNIGIGTTSPSQMLTVAGNILSSPAGNASGALMFTAGSIGSRIGIGQVAANELQIGDTSGWNDIRFTSGATEAMRILSGGTIGINTTTPSSTYKLDINGATRIIGSALYLGNTGGQNLGVDPTATNGYFDVRANGTGGYGFGYGQGSGSFIYYGGTGAIKFSVDNSGNGYFGGNVNVHGTLQTMTGSDFAEEFSVSSPLAPGTVVVMDDLGYKSVKPCDLENDSTVVGIVSDNPSIVSGHVLSKNKVVVAMMGVVDVKVNNSNGRIRKGTLLTTSSMPGYAMKADSAKSGTIIGKALENLSGSRGEIKVLVNLQ